MARAQRLKEGFSYGGRLPWAIGLLLSLTVVLSLASAFGERHGGVFEWVTLRPESLFHGEIWRLATWTFIEPSAFGLIFTCLAIYWFGTDLANEWGSGRFLAVFGGVALVSASGTCLVALADPAVRHHAYLGGWEMTTAMAVAWGLWFPERVIRIYFVLPVRGYWLAWLTVGLTIVFATYSGWEGYLPELFGEAAILGWLYRRTLAARWRNAQRTMAAKKRIVAEQRARAERRAKGAAYLRVVGEDDDDEPPPLPPDVEDKVRDLFDRNKLN